MCSLYPTRESAQCIAWQRSAAACAHDDKAVAKICTRFHVLNSLNLIINYKRVGAGALFPERPQAEGLKQNVEDFMQSERQGHKMKTPFCVGISKDDVASPEDDVSATLASKPWGCVPALVLAGMTRIHCLPPGGIAAAPLSLDRRPHMI